MNNLEKENELENFDNRIFDDIDIDVYNSLVKRNDFQYLAVLYKENRNAIYSCEDEELSEQYLKADTIRSLISYYSKKLSCSDLSLYIAKYVDTELVIQSRCLLNEKIEDCWKRAWDFYDKTFVNKVYKLVKNPDDIRYDIASFLSGAYGNFGVQRVFIVFEDRNARPSGEWLKLQKHGLINLLLAEDINISPIFNESDVPAAERDVHIINRYLNDGFYWYYTKNRWSEIGELKKDPDVCFSCGENPCICYRICPQCGKTNISCICCKRCGQNPCQCVAYNILPTHPGGMHGSTVYGDWKLYGWDVRMQTMFENFLSDGRPVGGFVMRANKNFEKQWGALQKVEELYTIPVRLDDFGFLHLYRSDVSKTGFNQPTEIDVACFIDAVKRRKELRTIAGIPPEYPDLYTMFFKSPNYIYVLASWGNLGDFSSCDDIDTIIKIIESVLLKIELPKPFLYNNENYTYVYDSGSEILYKMAAVLYQLGSDIQILKYAKRGGVESFWEAWAKDGIDREEDVIK